MRSFFADPREPARRSGARSRSGFTLIEVLVSMVMLIVVGNALLAMTLAMHRITRKQTETAAMQGSLRSSFQLLHTELVELGPQDLIELAGDRLRYRAPRGLGETCQVTSQAIRVPKSSYNGLRSPVGTRDGVWLFLDGDSTRTTDDRWITLALDEVSVGVCPGGAEAWVLPVSLSPADLAGAVVPGPVRTFEVMETGQVEEDGQQWLGIRSISLGEPDLVPVSGPVTWNGVRFSYLNGSDVATTSPSEVRSLVVTLRAITERPVGTGTGVAGLRGTDSLQLRVRLRN